MNGHWKKYKRCKVIKVRCYKVLWESDIETKGSGPCGPIPIISHQLSSPRWGGKRTGFVGSRQATENPVRRFPPGAPSRGKSLVLIQMHAFCVESSGFQQRRSRRFLTSPIYGGSGERSETEGAFAKVAQTVSSTHPKPLCGECIPFISSADIYLLDTFQLLT